MDKLALIHITDPHFSNKFGYRVDNVVDTLMNKFSQIKIYIDKYNVKGVLLSGDLFNSNSGAKISYDLTKNVISLLQSLNVPVYAIPGNHDLYLGSLKNHPLDLLFNIGTCVPVHENPSLIESGELKLMITGWAHKYEKDVSQFNNIPDRGQDYTIGLTHLVLGEKPGEYFSEPQYGIEEFTASPAHVFLNGHIHTPLGPLKNSKQQIFLQPGALLRTNSASEEISRIPQISLITFQKKPGHSWKLGFKYLPIEVKFDIFKDWKREARKELDQELNSFIEKIKTRDINNNKSLEELINELDASAEIKALILDNLP